jgi:hypothetical protein
MHSARSQTQKATHYRKDMKWAEQDYSLRDMGRRDEE